MEVKPASGLEVKHCVLDNTSGPQKLSPCAQHITPTSVSELTPSLTPRLTPSYSFNTELCIDLKTILTSDRKAKQFKDYTGVLTRDSRDHFTFIEAAQERKCRRNPNIYKGYTINVHSKDDGTIYPTFRQPEYTRFYTFKDFCREAAEELLMVVSLLEEE